VSQFPRRLHHEIPSWVPDGSAFHIRLRILQESHAPILTNSSIAQRILDAGRYYEATGRWYLRVLVLMPDHLHMLVHFSSEESMTKTIRDWKRFLSRKAELSWQENFFDHRIRNEAELDEKAAYIRMNPVRAELCKAPSDWPWKIDKMQQ
jgi:REP element-mobilizing transposase RayT